MTITEASDRKPKFVVGDKVNVTAGPHQHDTHEIIHAHSDGSYNVKPIGVGTAHIKYKLGAARAQEHQLKKIDEETVNEGILASLGGSLRFSVNNKEVSKDDVHKKWQDEAKAEAEKRWPSLSKKIADAKKPVSEETLEEGEMKDIRNRLNKRDRDLDKKVTAHWKKTTGQSSVHPRDKGNAHFAYKEYLNNKSIGLVEMDDATSVAKKIGVGNLDPVAGKKKTMADGKKKKTYRSVKAGMAKAHELAMRGMASVTEDVRDLHGTPMIHLVNSYTKGDKKVHVWQNHYGGYDYDVHHHNHKTGESHVENHKTSFDEIHAKLKGQGYKPVHESAEPIDEQDLFEGAMSELHAAMPKHWKDAEVVHGEKHRSGASAIVVRHKTHGQDIHYSTMMKHGDNDWQHIDSWGSLERAKQQIHEEADMNKAEIKNALFGLATTIREDKGADKDERDNAEPMGVPSGPGKSPPPKKKVVKESALEVPDIHVDVPPHAQYQVLGGERVSGKTIKYVRFGNFMQPISVVIEEEMWKDADGSIFKFSGQAAAQQAIHALLSGGGSHVASPRKEDGGEQGGGDVSTAPSGGAE